MRTLKLAVHLAAVCLLLFTWAFCLFFLLVGCAVFDWAPEAPQVVVIHPDATCEAASSNLAKLGGCGVKLRNMTFQQACERLNGYTDDTDEPIRAIDTGCIAAAKSCSEFERCD